VLSNDKHLNVYCHCTVYVKMIVFFADRMLECYSWRWYDSRHVLSVSYRWFLWVLFFVWWTMMLTCCHYKDYWVVVWKKC